MKDLKLPIPIFIGEDKIFNVSIKKPTSETIFETKKMIDLNEYFKALKRFITGCLEKVNDKTDKEYIKRVITELSINSAEYLAIQIMLLQYPDDDKVEGVYNCPRCGQQKICELKDDIDTRDSISELNVNYYEGENQITIDLEEQVRIADKNGTSLIPDTTSITFRFPTLKDGIEASAKVGNKNYTEIQKELYRNTLVKLNNTDAERDILNKYGAIIINKTLAEDLNKIGKQTRKYGLDNKVKKVCNDCSKEWFAQINSSNFFVSALQLI